VKITCKTKNNSSQLYMKIRADRIPGRSGTLYQRTKKKRLKNGKIVEYPLVEGIRDRNKASDWFWQLTWKEKAVDGQYHSQIASVKPEQVEKVKILIAGNIELETILAYLRGSM
jgi:hypothetical protein